MATIVDAIYRDHQVLTTFLDHQKEVSLKIFVQENFKKNLLLTIASYFETRVTEILLAFIRKIGNDNSRLTAFVQNGAIHRRYHTLFDWERNNANKFFSLFGEDCKNEMEEEVKQNKLLESAIKSFLHLGHYRNLLVHQNFGEFPVEKTAEELYDEYHSAELFITFLEKAFN